MDEVNGTQSPHVFNIFNNLLFLNHSLPERIFSHLYSFRSLHPSIQHDWVGTQAGAAKDHRVLFGILEAGGETKLAGGRNETEQARKGLSSAEPGGERITPESLG